MKKYNVIVAVLNYLSSVCFYICAILNFVNGNRSIGVVFLCVGSTFLCLGSVWLSKNKKSNKDHDDKQK